jgi:uncharacterized membrane protein YphA (DoxX/SURF4 family)
MTLDSGPIQFLILLNRLALGYYVMNAGWEKVRREIDGGPGTFFASGTFQGRSTILPDFVAVPFGYGWPWMELIFGFMLLIGLYTRAAAAVTTWLLASITIAIVMTDRADFFPRHYLMVFVPLAMLLLLLGPGPFSIDRLFGRSRS